MSSLAAIVAEASALRELDDGVELVFPSSDATVERVWALVLAERDCCSEFEYALSFAARHGPLSLRVQSAGPLRQALKAFYHELREGTLPPPPSP